MSEAATQIGLLVHHIQALAELGQSGAVDDKDINSLLGGISALADQAQRITTAIERETTRGAEK